VSARSFHSPSGDFSWSVVSNAGDDAWPVANALEEHLRG
jgi:hypothetical protein